MVEFRGGIKGAAEMLAGLNPKEQERLLEQIRKQDPQMAQLLEKNMTTFEDLRHLTPKMMVELLREIDLKDLALGLRLGSQELKNHFLKNLSKGAAREIEEVLLGPPQSVDRVQESIEKIMQVVREKVKKGELILSPDSEKYV